MTDMGAELTSAISKSVMPSTHSRQNGDEPFEHLVPIIVHDLVRVCAELAAAGLTIVVVEQNIVVAPNLATRAYILNNGHVVHEGPMAELKADRSILRRHLGV